MIKTKTDPIYFSQSPSGRWPSATGDAHKTRRQLIDELRRVRRRVRQLEASSARGVGVPSVEALGGGYHRVLELLATGHSLEHVLEVLASTIEARGNGMLCSILLLDDNRLRHGAAPSLPAAYVEAIDGVAIGPSVGSCGTAAYLGRRVVVEDVRSDPLWTDYRELAAEHGLRACWSQPILSADGEVLGTFAMYYRRPRRPDRGEQRLIETGAHIAGIAIERRLADRALRASRDQLATRVAEKTADLEAAVERLRALASELALAEERERRRIAVGLHDRIGQALSFARLQLETLRGESSGDTATELLDSSIELVGQAQGDIRSLTFELSPPVLYELGLGAAVEWLVDRHQGRGGTRLQLENNLPPKSIAEGLRVTLYRGVRELLANVFKHARAESCRVSIDRDGGDVRVAVVDDGLGFDEAAAASRVGETGGFGLFSLREQLERLGGRLDVSSSPGQGTRSVMSVPAPETAPAKRLSDHRS